MSSISAPEELSTLSFHWLHVNYGYRATLISSRPKFFQFRKLVIKHLLNFSMLFILFVLQPDDADVRTASAAGRRRLICIQNIRM